MGDHEMPEPDQPPAAAPSPSPDEVAAAWASSNPAVAARPTGMLVVDQQIPNAETVGLSPKTLAAAAGGVALSVLVSVLTLVRDQPGLLAPLPGWSQAVILAVVGGSLPGLVAYMARPGLVRAPGATYSVFRGDGTGQGSGEA